jgi:hypothetical protein
VRRAGSVALIVVGVGVVPAVAVAGRPDMGGDLHRYAPDDVLAFVDSASGRVRVHFSTSGPNQTRLSDADGDGTPDMAQSVAETADAVLDTFAAAGFRSPLNESAVRLEPLGGSDAFDFYLVDFGGGADGSFSVDACREGVCAGHMLVDNDFAEFNYPSITAAVRVLTSHEMFHAVQAAYREDLPVWLSEGTAVWAEDLFQPGVLDFKQFAEAYLEDADRPIDRPPVGPVPAFAYGTCLFWKFLTLRHDDALLPELLTQAATSEGLDAVEAALGAREDNLRDAFIAFTAANLNTAARANADAVYPRAAALQGLEAEDRGATLMADHRFYPLAASYWILDHPGGPLAFGTQDDGSALVLSLHATSPVGALTETYGPFSAAPGAREDFGDLPAGKYWLRGTYPERAVNSTKVQFCLGSPETLEGCGFTAEPDAGIEPDASTDATPVVADAFDAPQDATAQPDATGGLIGDAAGAGNTPGSSGSGGCQATGRAAPSGALPGLALGLCAALRLRRRRGTCG